MAQEAIRNPVLVALRLSEERACARYLSARKAMRELAGEAASLRELVIKHPRRADYQAALVAVLDKYSAAAQRTAMAWQSWHYAQVRTDSAWTATTGRAA